jgi:hypothetical protein
MTKAIIKSFKFIWTGSNIKGHVHHGHIHAQRNLSEMKVQPRYILIRPHIFYLQCLNVSKLDAGMARNEVSQ